MIRTALRMVVASAVLQCVAGGQQTPAPDRKPAYAADPANVPAAIAAVRSGDFFLVHVEMIAKAHAVEAIPDLERQFAVSKEADGKGKIANALVRLGMRDGLYWDYLVNSAESSLKSPAPGPFTFEEDGNARGAPPPELVAWARENKLSIEEAAQRSAFKDPGPITMLVSTGDPRAVPLARQALKSRNFMIQTMAARGLAQIQDRNSIADIIAAVRSAPHDAAVSIACALLYFDDTDAQRAADAYVPKEMAEALRAEHAKGKGPFD